MNVWKLGVFAVFLLVAAAVVGECILHGNGEFADHPDPYDEAIPFCVLRHQLTSGSHPPR
jgi:hypothetical protein